MAFCASINPETLASQLQMCILRAAAPVEALLCQSIHLMQVTVRVSLEEAASCY